jgi:putative nucleotidyltransferase with HDIG domain
MTPLFEKCISLMDEYKMPEHIRAHSFLVARIAHLIARDLADAGLELSVQHVTAAALLHDIGKTLSLESGGDHSEIGRQICVHHQLHQVADTVGEHVRLRSWDPQGTYSEKEIVYYADKRVNHDRIVSLDERLFYILTRYGKNRPAMCQAIRRNFERCRVIEKKLFTKLDFTPEALTERVRNERSPFCEY